VSLHAKLFVKGVLRVCNKEVEMEGDMKEKDMKPEELTKFDTDGLLELRDRIDEVLTHRRRQLEAQLERIAGRAAGNSASGDPQTYGQPKPRILPRYRSKKDPTATWSGRGVLPKWMRAETQGTKLTKDDFLISR
jgi:DNA-binding protein H-NS